jgi:hypothetical protein
MDRQRKIGDDLADERGLADLPWPGNDLDEPARLVKALTQACERVAAVGGQGGHHRTRLSPY